MCFDEWKGGDWVWIIEVVVFFGGYEEIFEDMVKNIFLNEIFKYYYVNDVG